MKKPVYQKLSQLEHVLKRSDMYVGSPRVQEFEEYVTILNEEKQIKIVKKTISYSPALLRIFIEPLSNIIDNVSRSKQSGNPVTRIHVDIVDGTITMWNDGDVVPIEMNEAEKMYNHSLIFGQLLSSSNYDDTEDRVDISGRNGLGVKLCCIFSKFFQVEGTDPERKKRFVQDWKDNMSVISSPCVTTYKKKEGYTKVVFLPDYERLGTNLTEDIIAMFHKYVIDTAMLTKVKTFFNGEEIDVSSLEEYAMLYRTEDTEEFLSLKTSDCDVIVYPSENSEFLAVSFANGVYTKFKGTHVDAWTEALFRPFVEKLNKPKSPQINIKDVKQFFCLFVVASVKQASYESQNKNKLESPIITAEVKKTHINMMMKWSMMEELEDLIRTKEFSVLKKSERKKGHVTIKGLTKANFEGTKKASECILILVEGLSAEAFALQGTDVGVFGRKGRNFIGSYALRGKLLNTRSASLKTIAENKIVDDIIKILGLRFNVDYTDDDEYKKLRYGTMLIIADADNDGIHICSLVINLIDSLFPSLMKRDPPFISMMQTPIVKVFLPKSKILTFYDEREFFKYRDNVLKNNPKATISKKFYKGLGSSSNKEVIDCFGKKMVKVIYDEKASNTMKKAFLKTQADVRKRWILDFDENSGKDLQWKNDEEEEIDFPLSSYIDYELIKFSIADCNRSIPSVIDGFKTSQRKILFGAIKRKLWYSISISDMPRVSQLAGTISEVSAYPHGEQNLYQTIIKMAQTFVGSNNISLFYSGGMFGTLSHLGEDSAQPRYISTKLNTLTRLIFREEDDCLLNYLQDDELTVEPEMYYPIIPMILINGAEGIGTGFSSSVPLYNPLEIIGCIRIWLEHSGNVFFSENEVKTSLLPELTPWYREFRGKIVKKDDSTYVSWGVIEDVVLKSKKDVVRKRVTEISVGTSIESFKCFLDELIENKQILRYDNYSKPNVVDFIVEESEDGMKLSLESLKLFSYIHTSNMTMFDENRKIRKYDSVREIIDSFCRVRFDKYVVRKKKLIEWYNEKIPQIENRFRFISEILSGKIKMFSKNSPKKMEELEQELEEKKYLKIDESYDYLLSMQMKSITAEKVEALKKELENIVEKRDTVINTSEKDMWLSELEELEKEYPSWELQVRKDDFLCEGSSKKK